MNLAKVKPATDRSARAWFRAQGSGETFVSVHVADQIDAAAENDHGRDGPKQKYGHRLPPQFEVQTLTDFMPVSASDLVLYTVSPLTTVVSVVVGFDSVMVHFLVLTS